MISITYYYNVFRKDKTKKYILGRQYEYSGKSLRGWTADGTGVFVCTMDDFDVSREETHGSTADIYLTWQRETYFQNVISWRCPPPHALETSGLLERGLKRRKVKGKAIPLQAWRGPEGSKKLWLPDFKTIGT